MFVLLLVVAVSIGLIVWSQHEFPGKGAPGLRPRDPSPKNQAMAKVASVPLFVSDRERRLWFRTTVAVMAITSTLGPAVTLGAFLRERNLLRVTTTLVLLVTVGAIARRWIKQRPGLGEIGVALCVTAVYLMVWVRVQVPEERTHLFEYGLFAVLIHQALLERLRHGRGRHGRRVTVPAARAVAVPAALLGWLDEGIQALLPNRVYDLRDAGVNALAGLMAIAASLVLGWARRRLGKARTG
jgi:hypothetical protein